MALPPYGEFSQPFTSVRTRYVTHQRNDQRNPSAWNFDVKIVKEINLPKGMNLQLDGAIFNLLNEDTYSVYNNFTKSGQQVNGTNDAQRRVRPDVPGRHAPRVLTQATGSGRCRSA